MADVMPDLQEYEWSTEKRIGPI